MNEKLEKIVSLMERDDSVTAPADSIRWAKNLFKARATAAKPSLLRRLIATLQADLKPDTAILGERSASTIQERQMLFVADGIGIDIRVKVSKKKFRLRGQILSETFVPAKALLSSASLSKEAKVNEDGFIFENLGSGTYTITIGSLETEVIIEGLSI